MVENNAKDKPLVMLPKLYLHSISKMVIERASHKLADQVPALLFQFLEQNAREYIDEVVR